MPTFTLVNNATGEAVQLTLEQVQLIKRMATNAKNQHNLKVVLRTNGLTPYRPDPVQPPLHDVRRDMPGN